MPLSPVPCLGVVVHASVEGSEKEPMKNEEAASDPFGQPEPRLSRKDLDRMLEATIRRATLSQAAASVVPLKSSRPPLTPSRKAKLEKDRENARKYRERMLSDPETAAVYRQRTNASHARTREKVRERMKVDPAFAAEVRAKRNAWKRSAKKKGGEKVAGTD